MDKTVNPQDAATTYRYVRMALVGLVVFLAASVSDTRRNASGWQTSISAYYYTSSHAVFITALCAVGICLIIYQGGTTTEDSLLNFSGVLAIIVGLVPTHRQEPLGPGLPKDFDPTAFVENNVCALLVASVAVLAFIALIRVIRPLPLEDPPTNIAVPWKVPSCRVLAAVVRFLKLLARGAARVLHLVEAVLPCVLLALIIAGAAVFLIDTPRFIDKAHGIAAVAMFCGIIVVVVHYAFYAAVRRVHERWAKFTFVLIYSAIALAMIVTIIVVVARHVLDHSHGVLIIEAILIAEFAVFWLTQSIDLWEVDKFRSPPLSDLLEKLGQPEEQRTG